VRKGNRVMDKSRKRKYTEIWEDMVSLKDLVLALILCIGLTMTGYFVAPMEYPGSLFFGLGGAVLGFILSSMFIKPKRVVTELELKSKGGEEK